MSELPYIEGRYNRYIEYIESAKTQKGYIAGLEARVKEQAILIAKLTESV